LSNFHLHPFVRVVLVNVKVVDDTEKTKPPEREDTVYLHYVQASSRVVFTQPFHRGLAGLVEENLAPIL